MISTLDSKFAVAQTVIISDFEASLIFLLEEFQVRCFDLLIFVPEVCISAYSVIRETLQSCSVLSSMLKMLSSTFFAITSLLINLNMCTSSN